MAHVRWCCALWWKNGAGRVSSPRLELSRGSAVEIRVVESARFVRVFASDVRRGRAAPSRGSKFNSSWAMLMPLVTFPRQLAPDGSFTVGKTDYHGKSRSADGFGAILSIG
jgi:hypothetical protein